MLYAIILQITVDSLIHVRWTILLHIVCEVKKKNKNKTTHKNTQTKNFIHDYLHDFFPYYKADLERHTEKSNSGVIPFSFHMEPTWDLPLVVYVKCLKLALSAVQEVIFTIILSRKCLHGSF